MAANLYSALTVNSTLVDLDMQISAINQQQSLTLKTKRRKLTLKEEYMGSGYVDVPFTVPIIIFTKWAEGKQVQSVISL